MASILVNKEGKPLFKDGKVYTHECNGGGYPEPTGTLNITSNGTHNVKAYESVNVNVSSSVGGVSDLTKSLLDKSIQELNVNDITTLGNHALNGCRSLTTVNLPEATSIGNSCFADCSKLQNVNLPKVTSVGTYAFSACTDLKTLELPEATTIDTYVFYNTINLETVNFPKLTAIGGSFFSNTRSLINVNIPEVTSIGNKSFKSCVALTNLRLPKVTSISEQAFYGCEKLTDLYLGSNEVVSLENVNAFTQTGYVTVHVRPELVSQYSTATNWYKLYDEMVIEIVGDYSD